MNDRATSRPRRSSRPIGVAGGVVVGVALAVLALALVVTTARPVVQQAAGGQEGVPESPLQAPSLAATSEPGMVVGGAIDKSPAAEKARRLGLAEDTSAPSSQSPRVMVKMADDAVPLDERLDLAAVGARVVRSIEPLDIWVVEFPSTAGEPAAGLTASGLSAALPLAAELDRLRGTPGVVWAVPETTRTLARVPNDDFYLPFGGRPGQWGLSAVGLEDVWDTQTGSASVVIGVLDSGIGRDIVDFAGRLVSPYSAVYQSTEWPYWEDVIGHGSGTAGVAAATGDNVAGIAGASWGAGIMPVHLTDESETLTDEAEVDGIVWAVDHGADVLNLSFGSPEPHAGEREAIEYALGKGVVVVASAGNGFEQGVWYPAAYEGVIAVGATGKTGARADFSSYGTGLDLMAPGVDIVTWGADRDSYFMWLMSGTSFSAPLVSGVVSLMLAEDPYLSYQEINTILSASADDMGALGWDAYTGHGQLDAAHAVRSASAWHQPATTITVPQTTTTVPPTTTTTTTLPPTTTTSTSLRPTTTTTTEPPVAAFSDVPSDHPYAAAIQALAGAGVVQGYADGRFGLQDQVTRQQFAKMIVLTLGLTPTEQMTAPFADVARVPGLYPDNYVALAYLLGISRGTSTDPPLFSPWASIARAQVISMVVRGSDAVRPGSLATPPAGHLPPFGRFSTAHDTAAARASFNGLLSGLLGMGPSYDVWRPATRGEVAAVLAPLLGAR